jgi:DNA-binding transcriptional MerR regulator
MKRATNPAALAKYLQVDVTTIRRWCEVYGRFLSASAVPAKGKNRALTEHDIRVLGMVGSLRDMGRLQHEIEQELTTLQADGWQGLPDLPAEWSGAGESVALDVAASRASELVQVAALQVELQHVRTALQAAQERVQALEAVEARNHALELDLATARGEVAALQARLAGYALGGEKPIHVGLIIAVALLAGAVLVALTFILARVLM